MKMHIKRSSDHSTQSIDLKAHIFIENRETKMIIAKKLHMKNPKHTHPNRIEGQLRLIPP
jgi:hypothetical protein